MILAKNVPTSSINSSLDSWRIRLAALYKKYISDGAEYQLNLSYGLHSDLHQLVYTKIFDSSTIKNDKEILRNIVFPLLCQVMDETIKLLNDSLQRFRQTPEYAKFEVLFDDKSDGNNNNISDNDNDGYPSDNEYEQNTNNNNNNNTQKGGERRIRRSRSSKRMKSLMSLSSFKRDSTISHININMPEMATSRSNHDGNMSVTGTNNYNNDDIKTPVSITNIQTPPITSMVGNASTTVPLQLPSFKPIEDVSNPTMDRFPSTHSEQNLNLNTELPQNRSNTPIDDHIPSQENDAPSMRNDDENHTSLPMTDDDEGSFVVLEDLDNVDPLQYNTSFKL